MAHGHQVDPPAYDVQGHGVGDPAHGAPDHEGHPGQTRQQQPETQLLETLGTGGKTGENVEKMGKR